MNSLVGPTIFLSAVGGLVIQLTSFTVLYLIVFAVAIMAIIQSLKLVRISPRSN
jgi:hypothetical protein